MKAKILSKLILLVCLSIGISTAKGQYVSIPDTNFGTWLSASSTYSGCVTGNNNVGWRLDTTCYPLTQAYLSLSCTNRNIYDLTGIVYFKRIGTLDCSYNQISALPALPTRLSQLVCSGNQLSSLPVLPPNLTRLTCGGNQITSLPALPATLTYMDCNGNQLTTLPALPAKIRELYCFNNHITALPALPDSLTQFSCSYNQLSALPTLPAKLYNLDCGHNLFAHLPPLPAGLLVLRCAANRLTTLPSLSSPFQYLDCDSNALTALPPLPTSLGNVGGGLVCSHNPDLYCLPSIDTSFLPVFHIAGSGITCLYHRFAAYDYDIDPAFMPLCSFSSGCPSTDNIDGHVYNDTTSACPLDSFHPGQPLQYIHVRLKKDGQIIQQCYTSRSGEYSFATDSLQSYTVEVDTAFLPFTVICPAADSIDVALSQSDSVAERGDFGLRCAAPDYGVIIVPGTPFKPGDTTIMHIIAGNPMLYLSHAICGAGASGSVTSVLNGPVRYVGPAPYALIPTAATGNALSYQITDLDSLQIGSLDILIATDTTATLGDGVCISAAITATGGDIYAQDDTMTRCYEVVSSYDPNHKTVDQKYISGAGEWLTYTVEFQNTGNAPAKTVVVRDTLSPLVVPETFRFIASDHEALVQLSGSAVAFSFPHINLPDSATDPIKSTGWLQYQVKSKTSLPQQTQITNTAFIYFDYNTAIVTNTAVTTVGTNTGITDLNSSNVHLYPNPNKGSFTLQVSGHAHSSYSITDMLGHTVIQQSDISGTEYISIPELTDGIYILQVRGAAPVRFVVMK